MGLRELPEGSRLQKVQSGHLEKSTTNSYFYAVIGMVVGGKTLDH